jgi:hypothetical protein
MSYRATNLGQGSADPPSELAYQLLRIKAQAR